MDKIIFATGNEGKMKEVRMILEDLGLPVLSLKDAGITADVEENGTTFEENAQIKAKAIMEMTGALVLADDSGLEVDALDKEPGIYSARYMGHDTSYHIKNQNIIDRLEGKQPLIPMIYSAATVLVYSSSAVTSAYTVSLFALA